ncbi:MAG: hypothetical protein IE881_06380 [Epsilonproteobacteria bacterium]|nr:hypothetical protein [Campylobacterota bacterium]
MRLYLIALISSSFLLSGCSMFAIGDRSAGLCDGECDYKEAGVCADVITIYKHRKELKNRKTKEHWFSKDEDPYIEKDQGNSSFSRLNEEDIYDR